MRSFSSVNQTRRNLFLRALVDLLHGGARCPSAVRTARGSFFFQIHQPDDFKFVQRQQNGFPSRLPLGQKLFTFGKSQILRLRCGRGIENASFVFGIYRL